MKKEVFLAIAIGFALGLVITFGIWTANKSLATLNTNSPEPTPTEVSQGSNPPAQNNTTPAPSTTTGLSISAPEDEVLTNKNSITLTGKAAPNSTVIVTFEGDQQVLLADAQGSFSSNVALIAGYNLINVTAFDPNGAESNQSLTVTYSTATI